MIRGLVFLVIALMLVAAVTASDREKPFLAVERQSSGPWDFNNAAAARQPTVPFLLTTPCTANSRTLPRWKDRTA